MNPRIPSATIPLARERDADKAAPPDRDKSQIQVIARAVALMRALKHAEDGLSLGALAAKLGLARSTVQRIVRALEAEGLLISASPTGRVKLGPGLLHLAASVAISVASEAKPFMAELALELGETVDLSVLGRDHATFVDQTIGSRRLYAISAIAERFPLYCSANGKAMLAELSDLEIERKIGRAYPQRTEHTLTSLEVLLPNLREVRRSGVAFDLEEHALGVCAVGVAVRDSLGKLFALSVPISTARFQATKALACERLLQIKARLEKRLGSHA